jgi:hypothetical protein
MRHVFLAAAMMIGALAITFGTASTLEGWATSRASYASADAPALVAPVATASEPASTRPLRARVHSTATSREVSSTSRAESQI